MRPALIGDRRHDPLVVEPERAVAGHRTNQPLRSVSTQLPIGRSRSGASSYGCPRAVGRADDDARDSCRRAALARACRRRRSSVRRATRRRGSPSRRSRAPRVGSRLALIDVDRPDRRPPVEVGLRPAIAGEGDRPVVGMPRDVGDAPVAARDLARSAAREVHDEEVRPAVEMALLVPAPVGAGDVADDRAPSSEPALPRREIGVVLPTMNRGGSTSAVNARRWPSGDQAISPTAPCRPTLAGQILPGASEVEQHGSPRPSRRRSGRSGRRRACGHRGRAAARCRGPCPR